MDGGLGVGESVFTKTTTYHLEEMRISWYLLTSLSAAYNLAGMRISWFPVN